MLYSSLHFFFFNEIFCSCLEKLSLVVGCVCVVIAPCFLSRPNDDVPWNDEAYVGKVVREAHIFGFLRVSRGFL